MILVSILSIFVIVFAHQININLFLSAQNDKDVLSLLCKHLTILHIFVIVVAHEIMLASFENHWESNIAEGSDEMKIAQNAKVARWKSNLSYEKRYSCFKINTICYCC